MKRCQKCNGENSDAMSFCLQCGTPLVAAPIVFNLRDDNQAQDQSAPDTAFNRSAETVMGGQPFPASFATASSARPKSNKKIFMILGGVFSLFGMLLAAGALIVYFNWKSTNAVVANPSPTPAPTRGIVDKSPSPKSSISPSVSPSASPDNSTTTPNVVTP
ncbi:MAG TPA: hypothetical protein VK308_14045, partial [Pyrinomonadaceae bacterium]|nr:hypothetical protein [Pyrinomonadaceae bacterium]